MLLHFDEVGVLKGDFAAMLHAHCCSLVRGTLWKAHRVYVVWTETSLDPSIHHEMLSPIGNSSGLLHFKFVNINVLTSDTVKAVTKTLLQLNNAWVCAFALLAPVHVKTARVRVWRRTCSKRPLVMARKHIWKRLLCVCWRPQRASPAT